jgi:hypothetical protein
MQTRRLAPVAIFAVAMAYLEAAVVVYLRRLFGVVEPWRDAGIFDRSLAAVEVGREAATLIMLLALGLAVGRNLQARLGFAVFAFGVWDIFYYVWLKVLLDWPASLLTPDILFLIPLPWWGPVIAPVLIALLMAGAGWAAVALDDRRRSLRLRWPDVLLSIAGNQLVLYAFMGDAIAALPATAETLARVRPEGFRWGIFGAGYLLMTASVVRPTAIAAGSWRRPGGTEHAHG